ncbi:hypothetical protein ACHAXS_001646, partial [Conticribra weissflogii]
MMGVAIDSATHIWGQHVCHQEHLQVRVHLDQEGSIRVGCNGVNPDSEHTLYRNPSRPNDKECLEASISIMS